MRRWDSRPIDEPTPSADAVTVTALAGALSAAEASVQLDFASEPPDESVGSADGSLSIPELTRCHAMVGQSPDP